MFPARWTIRTQPRKACAPVESDILSLSVRSSPTVNIVPEPRCSSRLCESGRMSRPGGFASLIQSSFGSPHGNFEAARVRQGRAFVLGTRPMGGSGCRSEAVHQDVQQAACPGVVFG